MDILDVCDPTPDSYRYILVIADYFSKWTEAFPIKNKCAVEIGAVRALPAGLRSPTGGAERALAYLCGAVRCGAVRAYDIDCGAGAGPRTVSYCGPLRGCIAYMRPMRSNV